MADDGLDLPASPAPAAAAPGEAAAPAAAQPDLATQLQNAMAPLLKATTDLSGQIKTAQQAQAKQQQQAPAAPARPKATSEEFWASLSENPEEAIGQIADARARGMIANTMGPGLVDVLVGLRDWRIEQVGRDVDERFGEGYFDDKIKPVLMKRFEDNPKTYTIWDQQNKGVVEGVVQGIVGNQLFSQGDEIVERHGKAKAAKAASKSPANLMGPGFNYAKEPERISPEVREGLGTLSRLTGFDEGKLVAARKAGNSLDGWLPVFRAARAGKGK